MRRAASSRPRRWGMDTIRGLDTLSLRGCKHSYGDAMRSCQPYDPPYEKRDRGARSPGVLERDARSLAGVAAIAIRVAIAHAAPAGGFRYLPAGRVARSAGLAEPAALFLHLMTRGITGCAGMAGQRAPVLHTLSGCAVLGRALRVAERGRADQQSRRRGDDQGFAHHGGWLLRFMSFHRGSRPQRPPLSARANARDGSTFRRRNRKRGRARVQNPGFDEAYCGTTWTVQNLGLSAQGVGRAHVA